MRTRRHKPNHEALLDRMMSSPLTLPMPQTMYDRWIELILANDQIGVFTTQAKISANDYEMLMDYSRKMGAPVGALVRVFVEIGLRAMKLAEYQDERFKAQYHMREALERVQYLSPNDRRTIREYLAAQVDNPDPKTNSEDDHSNRGPRIDN